MIAEWQTDRVMLIQVMPSNYDSGLFDLHLNQTSRPFSDLYMMDRCDDSPPSSLISIYFYINLASFQSFHFYLEVDAVIILR